MSLAVLAAYGAFDLVAAPCLDRRRQGVPPGGAFDTESFELANTLMGNDPYAPCWEVAMAACEIEALDGHVLAVVGGQTAASGLHRLMPGDRMRVEVGVGCRSYLAVPGGFASGSFANSLLRVESRTGASHRLADAPKSLEPRPIRYVPATASALSVELLTVSMQSNRVGLRLEGSTLPPGPEVVSEQCTPGTIQSTPDGTILVHGPDGPTIGGYPKLGVVARVDLDRLAQLRPGSAVTFQEVEVDEARKLWAFEKDRRTALRNALRLGL